MFGSVFAPPCFPSSRSASRLPHLTIDCVAMMDTDIEMDSRCFAMLKSKAKTERIL